MSGRTWSIFLAGFACGVLTVLLILVVTMPVPQ